jgi:putative sterol carrier protein
MTEATAAFFHELEEREHDPLLQKIRGTLRFELENGKRAEHWVVAFDKGKVHVSQGDREADCTVRTKEALFAGLITGKVNAMAAVLRGDITVEGDRELILRFQRLFPGPPADGGKG